MASIDLIGHWRFDETIGDVAVNGISGNNGTWIPGANILSNWRPNEGLLGGALELPGEGTHQNYFAVSGFQTLNGTPEGMTISVWMRPQNIFGYRRVFVSRTVSDDASGGGDGQLYEFAREDDHIDGRVSTTELDTPGGSMPASGEWIRVVWVWDNTVGT